MNRKLAFLLLLVLCVGAWTVQSRTYEYKTVQIKLDSSTEKKLNEIGGQGWEMVSAEQRSFQGSSIDLVVYHFKRIK